ncbi:MAG: hypothetical protein OGMRLDGQ_001447 [Candidatus Fervidibacter sp.]
MEVAKPLPVVAEEAVQPKVRWAAVILTLALVAGFSVVSGWAALLRHEILGTGYLPRGVVPLFLVIVLINALVKKVTPKLALTRTELAFVFALLTAIAAIPGQEFGIHFYLNLLGLVYYSSPQSQWFNLFTPHLPSWLVPSLQFRDPAILWAYEGMPAGAKMPLGEWLIPLLVWTPYLFGIYALLVCLCGLMARQWEEHERLLYPLTQVPRLHRYGDCDFVGSEALPCRNRCVNTSPSAIHPHGLWTDTVVCSYRIVGADWFCGGFCRVARLVKMGCWRFGSLGGCDAFRLSCCRFNRCQNRR